MNFNQHQLTAIKQQVNQANRAQWAAMQHNGNQAAYLKAQTHYHELKWTVKERIHKLKLNVWRSNDLYLDQTHELINQANKVKSQLI